MNIRLVVAFVALTAASLTSCTTPSVPPAPEPHPPVRIDPEALPQGPAPQTDYLVGRTIHASDAAPVSLPRSWNLGYRGSALVLVGRAGDEWYVERHNSTSYLEQLYRVTSGGDVRQIDTGSWEGGSLAWYLSDDDRSIIKVQENLDHLTQQLTVLDLKGAVIARHGAGAGGALVGASGSSVWYDGGASGVRVQHWDLERRTTTMLPVTGYLADPARDLLFTLARGHVPAGLTSLSQPRTTLRWSADFTAVAVSPDGTKVVGFRGSPTHENKWIVDIRNMDDGSLIQAIRLGDPTNDPSDLWWDDDQHILMSIDAVPALKTFLVRCSTDGACDRAAPPTPPDDPYSHRLIRYVEQRSESVTDSSGSDLSDRLIVPAGLPLGAPASSDYLVGRDVHLAGGGVIHLPSTWSTSSGGYPLIGLVGEAGGAYYVQRGQRLGAASLYRVTSSSVRLVDDTRGTSLVGWFLSSDDQRLIRAWNDGYDDVGEEVMDLDGAEIAQHDNRGDSNFNGASSTDLWYTIAGEGVPTRRWSIGSGAVTEMGAVGYLAVPDRDLLFTAPGLGIGPGVTSLSQPGALTWEAQFRAVAVSPDGTKVLGYKGFTAVPGQSVQIRNLSDGSLVRSFRFPTSGRWGDIWWESDSDVLLSYTTSDAWLVRCPTTGACRLVARDPSAGLDFTHRAVPSWHVEIAH